MDSCLLPIGSIPFFCFLDLKREPYPAIDTGSCLAQQLAKHRDISTAKCLHKNFVVPFHHIPSSLDKALIEKSMVMQVWSFCISNWSSGTTLQQEFVICKVGPKHLMMNILVAVHFAYFFSPSDHKKNTARHFLDKVFCEMVASETDNQRRFSGLRPNSREIMFSINAIIICIVFGAWIQ